MIRVDLRGTATLLAALTAALLCLAVPAALAAEGEVSVTEYRERAEPICKVNVEANKTIFKGVQGLVKRDKLMPASRRFKRAAAAFAKTIGQLAKTPPASGYEAKLGKWLTLLRKEKTIIAKIGAALAHDNKHKAESFSLELKRNSNKANNAVLDFGFNYCQIEPSRFG